MFRPVTVLVTYTLLVACAAPTAQQSPATAQLAPAPVTKVVTKVPERPFPAESIYPLLVAEFALRRNAYDLALDNYLQQSEVLKDAKVSAHTTHLAQFLRRENEALAAVQQWLALEPDNAEANNTLAALLVRKGRTLEALPHLAAVQRQGIEAKFTSLLAGFSDLNASQQAQLKQGIAQLQKEFPANEQLLLSMALIHAQLKEYEPALVTVRQLLQLQPQHPQAALLEARVLLASGADHPFTRIEKLLADTPDNTQLRLQYARLLTNTDMNAARAQFEMLSAAAPKDGDLLLSLALINREVGDNLEARAYLKQLLSLHQREDEAHYYLGRIAEDQGDAADAVEQYMQVGDSREYLGANNRLGRILVSANELDKNHAWFEQQRARHARHAEILFAMEADLLTQAGHNDAAMQILNRALQQFPSSTALHYARSMLGEQQGDLALMEADLRAILQNDPDNSTALNALGYTLANHTDRYSEALALVSRALELQPDEPAILDSMGWVLYHTGRYREAIDYLTKAYAAFPDPEVAAHLGEALWVSGDTDRARQIWQGALLKDPDHAVLLDTLQRLGVADIKPLPTSGHQTSTSGP